MTERMIAHLDADAFYVSIELQRHPELRGKPVVVAGSGPRSVVTTASYEAREYGVGSAMPTTRARRLCPQATFLPPDFNCYRKAAKQVFAIVRSHFEQIEVMGLDELYIDLSEMVSPRAAVRRLVNEIAERTGLSYSVGIGPNKLVAKVASDAEKPKGFVALTSEQARQRFAQSTPRLLPGIGPKTSAKLSRIGIDTIAALAATSPEALSEQFGERLGPYLHRRAHFQDDSPISEEREAVSESRERTFSQDIVELEAMYEQLAKLSERLCSSLQARGHRGRTISIKVRLSNFTTVTRARTLEKFVNDSTTVTTVACELLRAYAPAKPVRLLGVRVAGFEQGGQAQQSTQPEPTKKLQQRLLFDD
jgi:DNA polymerase-4